MVEATSESTSRNILMTESLLNHAARLFDERGYAETRLQDIAESVGISRPSIYYYFKTKEDILIALLWDMISAEYVLEPVSDPLLTPYQRLKEIMLRIGMQVVKNPARVRIFNRYLNLLPREVVREYSSQRIRLQE